ncbi:MAG: recombinase family protein [Phycisphaeraceae bacterium]|nr:recombinase family protein [Phycisphaeraceae bacterium]
MTSSKDKDKPVRCAIYTRKSTEENLNLDFNSLDAQREAGEAYIKSQQSVGWTCLNERYDDGGYSGGNIDRPAFQRLMADVDDGKIDCIVVYKIDRLSRSLMDFARIMQSLDQHGVSLVSVTQQFNTTTSMGRLTLNILLSFAQFEREIISERTRDKIAMARRRGQWTGGPPVLGYDRQRDNRGTRIIVNKQEAERIRAIYQMYLDEGSMLPTIRALRALGWKTKRYETAKGQCRGGVDFDKSALRKLLTNVVYLGKVMYKDEVHEGEHEAIIDEDLFARVQGLLHRNRNTGGTHSGGRNKHGAMLKGLVRCKACGCAMSHHFATRGNKRYRYYVCIHAQKKGWDACPSPSLPAHQLEQFVLDQIKSLGRDPGILEDSLRTTQERLQHDVDDLKRQRGEIEVAIKALGRQVGEVASRAGFDDGATRELSSLQDQIRERQQEAAGINAAMTKLQRRMLNPDELTGAVEAFDPLWNTLPPTQRARLVQLLVERVEYDGANESISLTFHPTGIRTLTQQRCEEATCLTN